jgi:23S rRNA pseudouridine1911/1915/1917 synthase
MSRAGDDAERSDEEERRMIPAGDDAERSDEEERRMIPAGDDAERRDGLGVPPPACGGERRS